MKIEKRGKYAGVKVHLEPDEAEVYMKFASDMEKSGHKIQGGISYLSLSAKLGKKISALMVEEPGLLKARTPDEIKVELENEFESAKLKLAAIKQGGDWKEVHVK